MPNLRISFSALVSVCLIGALMLIAAFSPYALAHETWQYVSGDHLSFIVPDRPVYDKAAYDEQMKIARSIPDFGADFVHGLDQHECPVATALLVKIFRHLVDANGLKPFIDQGPGMALAVSCDDGLSHQDGLLSGAEAIGTNTIVFGAGLAQALASEDEIAFIMAHEMSHVLLGHTEFSFYEASMPAEQRNSPREEKRKQQLTSVFEPAADIHGAILTWNAGYNPYAGPAALTNSVRFYFYNQYLYSIAVFLFDDGHGSNSHRSKHIVEFLDASSASKSLGQAANYTPILSPDLEAARREYKNNKSDQIEK